jgi:aryl-alcohol dehydrogenase-like predicted oxidoreductase/enamine deaminase RidA (YjgF/YER057c/UK114 family)
VQLFTKWVPKPGRVSKAEVHEAAERALSRLGVESIDLLQYHAWNYADPCWLETLFDLQDLKTRGLIRHLGLTNVDTAHLRVVVASGIDVVSNQVSFSLLDQRAAGGLAPFCVEHGVQLLAYGTLAGGWLTDRWLGAPEPDWESPPTWSLMKYGRVLRVAGGWSALQRLLTAAASVAARHGVSIANVASRFILDQPGVAGVIIGARLGESEHIDDTLRLFSFALTDDDRAEIRAALATLQPIAGDCGDEYRKPPFLTASGDLSHHLDSMPAPYQTVARDRGRTLCLSGTPWEGVAGFARAVRQGRRVVISGTTATMGDRVIGGSDPAAQAHFVIDKIEGALQSLGAALADVIRTRVYVRNIADWEPVARAHGARFGAIQPANTLVAAALVGDDYLVEIEAEAEVGSEDG